MLSGFSIISLAGVAYLYTTFDSRVEKTIVDNPKIVLKAIQKLQSKQKTGAEEKLAKTFKAYVANIDFPASGALEKDSDIVIYEWMDYQCGYCKATYKTLKKMTDNDTRITVKYIDYPILGQVSTLASYVAMSARNQGKYMAFHSRLMEYKGRLSETIIFEQAELAGLNISQVKKDITSTKIKDLIQRNIGLGKSVGATGTPYMIVYGEKTSKILGGFVKEKPFKDIITKIRNH